ncbi:Phosphatidylserine decarboxylase proenzyme 3 [Hypsizygus marmoreus]|uniref:Phosphatidylserine decarboxylase proenzyme 2 n=1 Tax=Hypsizygus marmoreus TaxID=39966 RepID=A0A369K1P6_HYPMA|nr:Phosphatidylserine decarboxylase proenzyme 3 [Hypsizygus marmoreus]
MCHRPRMSDKAEMDIITHLAVCASQDWEKVDRIVVGDFVTASQAAAEVVYEDHYEGIKWGLSAWSSKSNSANIIVQSRMTGQLEEEKMQVYVRLGIRLLYKGATSRMEGGRARRLLKSLSIKQGIKYDAPESALDIPTFIEFHGLKVEEILDPLDSFKTFNEFFYRKLKPSARPIEKPDDPYRLVSAADCCLMTFATIDDATHLWIKGREFTVARLVGDAYKDQAERYTGGALAIFRLAPQDYHRYHSPVEGKIGPMTVISGEYYTVNPQAIRSSLDVYGENVRKIVPIDSPHFGRVMAVCIGAMMVGSIKTTVQEGEYVLRGQEFGYFAFGGSTIVLLFEKDAVEWDEDLLINGRASLETLVRVGMGIGNGRHHAWDHVEVAVQFCFATTIILPSSIISVESVHFVRVCAHYVDLILVLLYCSTHLMDTFGSRQIDLDEYAYQHLLTTNDEPLDAEVIENKSVIAKRASDLAQLEAQVLQLTDVATPLMERYNHDNHEKHILSCFRRILSPVRRLHSEILAEIFWFTRDGTKDQSIPDFEPITVGPPPGPSPLRITHVCAD